MRENKTKQTIDTQAQAIIHWDRLAFVERSISVQYYVVLGNEFAVFVCSFVLFVSTCALRLNYLLCDAIQFNGKLMCVLARFHFDTSEISINLFRAFCWNVCVPRRQFNFCFTFQCNSLCSMEWHRKNNQTLFKMTLFAVFPHWICSEPNHTCSANCEF